MNTKQGVWVGVGMVVCALMGAGIEHVRMIWISPEEAEPEVREVIREVRVPVRPEVPPRDEAAEQVLLALRKRVAELEQALAERGAAQAQEGEPERPRRGEGEERQRRMFERGDETPEQLAERQQRRDEFRQRIEQRARDRAEFLAAVDVKGMTEEQRTNHEQLLATIERVNALMEQMRDPEAARTQEMRQAMGEAMATLGELYSAERTYLFEQTAKAVGYSGSDAAAFVEHIQSVIDNTSMMPGGMGGPGGPGFGRRGR